MARTFFSATLLLWLLSVSFQIGFNNRPDLLYILAGASLYQLANWVFRSWVSRDPLFVNTSVSLLHSTITSTSVVFVLVNQWLRIGLKMMFDHTQLMEGSWPWAYQALYLSCGYFAYDQWDVLQYNLCNGFIPGILMHHLILLICFTLALYRHIAINFLALALICEMHSVFLHVRKLRRMTGVRDAKSRVVKVEWILNWITYVFARLASHVLITAKLISDGFKFKRGIAWPIALFGMVYMNILDAFLGIYLFNAFQREKKLQQNNQKLRE